MYTPGKLYTMNDSDFDLGCLPFPKLTLFGDDRQLFDEENDSGLGMEEVSSSAQQTYKLQIKCYFRF